MTPFQKQDEYSAACALVLSAPNREAAFEDYAATIKAYRANGWARIDGKPRHEIDFRRGAQVNPFESDGMYMVYALWCADAYGITMQQLADLFQSVPPESGHQALCIVEDAICILEIVGESV